MKLIASRFQSDKRKHLFHTNAQLTVNLRPQVVAMSHGGVKREADMKDRQVLPMVVGLDNAVAPPWSTTLQLLQKGQERRRLSCPPPTDR